MSRLQKKKRLHSLWTLMRPKFGFKKQGLPPEKLSISFAAAQRGPQSGRFAGNQP